MVWPPPTILAPTEGEPAGGKRAGEPGASPPVTGAFDSVNQITAAVPVAFAVPAAALPATALPPAALTPTAMPPAWMERPERLVGSVLGGRYRITGVLGLGPMGIACEGESPRGRQVTLKLIPRPLDLAADRFAWQVREALALAHFDHPNVVPSTDFGSLEDGSAFVSRSRAPGVPLRAVLLRQGALPVRRALEIALQIAAALAAAHAQDICHGRLKPENVLVQVGLPAGDLVRVVDFGLARLPLAAIPTRAEAVQIELRSRAYLPGAELVGAARSAGPALDLYSLGVLLFEMIAGRVPFLADPTSSSRSSGRLVGFAEGAPPVQVPPSVEDLVTRLLLAPTELSAAQLAAALESLLGRPSVAPPLEPVRARHASVPPEFHASAAPPEFRQSAPPEFRQSAPPEHHRSVPQNPSWPPLPPGYTGSLTPSPMAVTAAVPPPAHSPSQAPFGYTTSFPPPALEQRPLGATPSVAPIDVPLSEEDEAELRPSLLARLRRLFVRAKADGS